MKMCEKRSACHLKKINEKCKVNLFIVLKVIALNRFCVCIWKNSSKWNRFKVNVHFFFLLYILFYSVTLQKRQIIWGNFQSSVYVWTHSCGNKSIEIFSKMFPCRLFVDDDFSLFLLLQLK